MPRFNITMSQELWDRVGVAAPEGNRSWFIRRALEAALGDGPAVPGSSWSVEFPGIPAAPVADAATVAGAVDDLRAAVEEVHGRVEAVPAARRCELDCGRPVPTSPKATRCSCGGRLVS